LQRGVVGQVWRAGEGVLSLSPRVARVGDALPVITSAFMGLLKVVDATADAVTVTLTITAGQLVASRVEVRVWCVDAHCQEDARVLLGGHRWWGVIQSARCTRSDPALTLTLLPASVGE
jgi:hypothetical protein